jgi:alpha-beta hydrolase superfamily lysophospholipase
MTVEVTVEVDGAFAPVAANACASVTPRYDEAAMPSVPSVLDHPLLSARYFFPRRDAVEHPFLVTASDGTSVLACYRAAPHKGALTVLHFHGNAEVVADYVPGVAQMMNDAGLNVVFAEYRGFGASTGSPTLGTMLDDAEVVFKATGVPAERIVPFGRSLGSLFAVEVAARNPTVAGMVLESGIADPLDRSLMRVSAVDLGVSETDLETAVRARLDQRAKLMAFRRPLLIFHTAADGLIAPSHAERNFSWAGTPAREKELVLFQRGDHGTIFMVNHAEYASRLLAFFRRLEQKADDAVA